MITNAPTGLRSRSRAMAGLVLAMATVSLVAGCAAIAEDSGGPATNPSAQSRPSATATPTPTPSKIVKKEEVRGVVPFTTSTVEDPNLDVGSSALVTAGRDGERVITYEVVYEDGKEVERTVVSDVVSVQPIQEVTAKGTRVPPPPPPEPVAPAGTCDPNYSGPCVPVAPDVDCAGGSGNGPAYVSGPVYVVGVDIYDLDRDGDGIACD